MEARFKKINKTRVKEIKENKNEANGFLILLLKNYNEHCVCTICFFTN